MNGRRLAPYALSGRQSVDLSGIGASAIECVEILMDGASAVYGTDAIDGVINFILRKDFRDAEVDANYFPTQQGGGDNRCFNATAGMGDLARDKYIFRPYQCRFDYANGSWGATLANGYQSGYSEVDLLTCEDPGAELNCSGRRRVGTYSVWDVQGLYTGVKNATLTLGVRNVLDRPPPVSNQGFGVKNSDFQAGYDPTYADPRGRMPYGAVQYAFR